MHRTLAALVAVSFLAVQAAPSVALADNQMGYQLLSADQAAGLPRNGGKLGMQVGRAQQITSGGLTFDVLRVNAVSPGSSGAQAGFKVGDQIIAVDGRVFPSVAAFAAYVGSRTPAQQISVDYMPSGGGPEAAQRVGVTIGGGRSVPAPAPAPQANAEPQGLSTGTKVAIGIGAAALFGCYKLGCFAKKQKPAATTRPVGQTP